MIYEAGSNLFKMASLLDRDFGAHLQEGDETLLHSLLLEKAIKARNAESTAATSEQLQGVRIVPEPGFCMKTRSEAGEKVFVNVCTSDLVPSPPDVSDEQLIEIVQSEDPMRYRVPMSLGEPHAEVDNAGAGCTVYDVVINTTFYTSARERPLLQNLLLTIVLEGLEGKYGILLSRECKIMQHRKSMGSLQEHFIRQKSKPTIIEMDESVNQDGSAGFSPKAKLITEIGSGNEDQPVPPEPEYTILREPLEGEPEFLVMEVKLPKVPHKNLVLCPGMEFNSPPTLIRPSSQSITLDVGEDRVRLVARPNVYQLDIDLPFLMDVDGVGAQFNRDTRVLSITLPVTGVAPL